MWSSPIATFSSLILIASVLATCLGMPQAASTSTAVPTASPIPWSTKIEAFETYVLEQPDQNASKGFGRGPFLRKTFDDGVCLQIGLYDWDCNHEIPYKMRGVAKWLHDNISRDADPIWDTYRYYVYGYYADPEDGWNFYGASRLSFGACGNRGPQSSCGVTYCVDQNGTTVGQPELVPEGQTPWMDPNDRNRLCPWLRHNKSAG
ncbi:hypothetical protein HBI17_204000 [Parastagonospora nodorum]|nr:hypothetical protein HBI12_207600 [Parastagonospora nodorum]KAH5734192.1 hypothetical protein HBI17_204000 [Parastagonospora nodorum]